MNQADPALRGLASAIGVRVRIILLDQPEAVTDEQRGLRMAEALAGIAARGRVAEMIPDPIAWQREVREDRSLPGRET